MGGGGGGVFVVGIWIRGGAGGVEGEREGPEAVGMAVGPVVGGEAEVAGGGGGFFDGAEVGAEEFVGGDAEVAGFEGVAEGVGEVFLDVGGEGEGFDAALAEALLGAFGELAAEAGGIEAGAAEAGEGEALPEEFLLGVEGLVGEDGEVAGEEEAGGFFEEPEDGEVAGAANVHAEVEVLGALGGGGEEVEGFVFRIRILGGGEEVPGEEGGGFVGGLAHVFLEEGFVVGAGVADEVVIGGVVHGEAGIAGRELGLELGEEALVEGVLEGDAVEGEFLGVAAVAGFGDEGVEVVGGAAVGGEDFELAAPGDAGVGNGVEFAGVGVEGEFVEEARAAFAGLGVGVGGEGVEAGVVGEVEGGGGEALGVGEDGVIFTGGMGAGGAVEDGGEFLGVVEEEAGLGGVAGGDPGVEAVMGVGLAGDEGVGGGPGHADLAGFLEELEAAAVEDPGALVGEEEHGVMSRERGAWRWEKEVKGEK